MSDDITFAFLTVPKVEFGRGKIKIVGESAARFGKRPLLVCGRKWLRESEYLGTIRESMAKHGLELSITERIPPEPSLDDVRRAIEAARSHRADVIIGIGGGSVIDVAKAAAALLEEVESLGDYFLGRVVEKSSIPFIAIPTTAGSGRKLRSTRF